MNLNQLEERITKLEREVTFVKAQGLSRDEQEVLLDQHASSRYKNRSIKLIWTMLGVQFLFIFYLYYKSELFAFKVQKLENQAEDKSAPVRNQPFKLP